MSVLLFCGINLTFNATGFIGRIEVGISEFMLQHFTVMYFYELFRSLRFLKIIIAHISRSFSP
ncbi:hypothetical protein KsCSTR_38750 [Candidatus Kuenenia stuttgartiensis]|uniref:Uncharacterized protein n=1 Tax=Kuenenia stuttgartiensis TaxID=174633 RepID=A0A6G7GV70_KUEST|nr:hypothetical protein KsCSTR_38750 [Candidatus Kuenenia stuttgartiensis]